MEENVKYENFRGNEIIVLFREEEDEYPVRLGRSKCRLILANIEAIKQFVDKAPVIERKDY